jgi:CDP-diacylglycerol---serine O-phosphatidyltransferase
MFIDYPTPPSGRPKRQATSAERDIALRRLVPNAITLASLCCGLAAMHYANLRDFDRAIFAILLAGVFDALDGRAARLLKVTSPFGEVLDSLADFLSFGLAPMVLLYLWVLQGAEVLGLAAAMSFVVCSALRLARFTAAAGRQRPAVMDLTIEAKRDRVVEGKFFQGMPTPAAAVLVLVPAMLDQSRFMQHWLSPVAPVGSTGAPVAGALGASVSLTLIVVSHCFLVAMLMISQLRMYSFKTLRVPRPMVVPLLALVAIVAVLMVRDVWLAMVLLAGLYVGTIPFSSLAHRRILQMTPEQVLDRFGQPRVRRRRRPMFRPKLTSTGQAPDRRAGRG